MPSAATRLLLLNNRKSPPVNTIAPVISGTVLVGQTLSTTDGTWIGTSTIIYTYQWNRNGVAISGATSSTYVLVAADGGAAVTVTVTAANGGGSTSASSAAVNTLRTNLVSYWKLDEASGARADSIGSNNLAVNGTGGVGSAAAKLGMASAQFVSANSNYLSIADNASMSAAASTSFEFAGWVYFDTLSGAVRPINKGNNEYMLQVTTTSVVMNVWCATALRTATKSTTINTSTWYFINGWFDTDGKLVGAAVNAGTPATTNTVTASVDDGANGFHLGGRGGIGEYVNGRMDEVGYWKGRLLTTEERVALYNSGAGYNSFLP